MFKAVAKYKLEITIGFFLVVLYFILRLPNLTLQPIFADEAIYIRWAQVMKAEPTLRFLPLSDGKTPLFMWALIPLFSVFKDPLMAGRMLSVLSGAATFAGVIFLGWKFFSARVGLLAALLIAVVPYIVFFDRMALVDSMASAFAIWALNLSLLLIQYPRIDLAMTLGYILGGGLLTKPPGLFNILVLPASILSLRRSAKSGESQNRLLKILGLWALALVIAFAIYNILRLGPGFSTINSRNQDYIFSPWELKNRPLDPFIPHLRDFSDWLPKLITVPYLLLFAFGLIWGVIKKNKYLFVILVWGLIPLFIQTAFLRTFTARYTLFSIPPLLFVTAWGIDYLIQKFGKKKNLVVVLALLLTTLPSLYTDYFLITNPVKASLPRSERRGYLEDWTAGYGLKEIARYLNSQSLKGLVVVGTEGSFGTLPDGLQIYLNKNSQVVVVGGNASISAQLKEAAKLHPTFYVSNKSRFNSTEGVELIKSYPKAIGPDFPQDAILLYKVLPK